MPVMSGSVMGGSVMSGSVAMGENNKQEDESTMLFECVIQIKLYRMINQSALINLKQSLQHISVAIFQQSFPSTDPIKNNTIIYYHSDISCPPLLKHILTQHCLSRLFACSHSSPSRLYSITNYMGNKTDCSQQCAHLNDHLKKSPAYGHFEIILNKDREYALVSKSIDKHTITKHELEIELQRRKNIKSPHLISLCGYSVSEDLNFIDFKLQYEYIPWTLTDKIKYWRQNHKKITENELSNIILGVEEALHYLYKIGIGHRCINLQTILCFNTLYKLSDISMVTFLTGYDLARQGDENQFLSTNLLEYLHFQGTDPQYEIQDDLFSLALVSLCIILECSPKDFYIRKEGHLTKLNRTLIDEGLQAMSCICRGWLLQKLQTFLCDGLKQQSSTSKQSGSRKRSSFMV